MHLPARGFQLLDLGVELSLLIEVRDDDEGWDDLVVGIENILHDFQNIIYGVQIENQVCQGRTVTEIYQVFPLLDVRKRRDRGGDLVWYNLLDMLLDSCASVIKRAQDKDGVPR